MAQLIVRNIEESIVRKLKKRAGEHGVSMEEEHRKILRDALGVMNSKQPGLIELLLAMPDVGPDSLFERKPASDREIEL